MEWYVPALIALAVVLAILSCCWGLRKSQTRNKELLEKDELPKSDIPSNKPDLSPGKKEAPREDRPSEKTKVSPAQNDDVPNKDEAQQVDRSSEQTKVSPEGYDVPLEQDGVLEVEVTNARAFHRVNDGTTGTNGELYITATVTNITKQEVEISDDFVLIEVSDERGIVFPNGLLIWLEGESGKTKVGESRTFKFRYDINDSQIGFYNKYTCKCIFNFGRDQNYMKECPFDFTF